MAPPDTPQGPSDTGPSDTRPSDTLAAGGIHLGGVVLPDARSGEPFDLGAELPLVVLAVIRHRH